MRYELKTLQRETGITFVFVTHDQEEALTMSDRIAVINEGEIQQIGEPEQIYESPSKKFVANFIGEANLSHYNLGPKIISYNKYIGRYELYIYRTLGIFLSYFISYITRPKRIFRTIKSIFIDSSSTIVEQRIKDYLRKSKPEVYSKLITALGLRK